MRTATGCQAGCEGGRVAEHAVRMQIPPMRCALTCALWLILLAAGAAANGPTTVFAIDRGPDADADVLFYSAHIKGSKCTVTATRRSLAVTPVATLPLDGAKGPWELGGLAARNGRLAATLTNQNGLAFLDARRAASPVFQSLPDFPTPRGVAFAPDGTLWVLSANSLAELQFTSDGHFNPIHHRADFDDPRHLAIDSAGNFCIAQHGAARNILVLSKTFNRLRTISHCPQQKTNVLTVDAAGLLWAGEAESACSRFSAWLPFGSHPVFTISPAVASQVCPHSGMRLPIPGVDLRFFWP